MDYNFSELEQRWRKWWKENATYKTTNDPSRPKHYVLDMFPYPSGAGLHVGHPLGYIASDIYARYKRMKGYNVLHPMGFDAFGLPAEQYALETGQHPAETTEKNIARYREQLDKIGFSYDWERSVRTSDPAYYKWTQWIFIQLFQSWFDRSAGRARPIAELVAAFESKGNQDNPAPGNEGQLFSKEEWLQFSPAEQREVLMQYRLAYLDWAEVWWCEALGTVLANDEVINGVSERGGHPCVRKKMRQWMLRITEYAERLLDGLETLEWSEAMKEMQRNWIGKSSGAALRFELEGMSQKIEVFTTRPDTIFGVDFLVLAPEHELVNTITSATQQEAVAEYQRYAQRRSERERMAETKTVSGAFTGAFARHPFHGKSIPVYIAEYVLAGYGTGAIMAVPSGDERDFAFARHFEIPITNVFGARFDGTQAYSEKAGVIENSDFLTGLKIADAMQAAIQAMEEKGIGKRRIQYKLRDAGFSRQRYWGEPFPIIYHEGIPYSIDEAALHPGQAGAGAEPLLPLELPHVDHYGPGPEGQGPLANIEDWAHTPQGLRETNTMPGYAGSSWYFLRYMDPHNEQEFASRAATDYWRQVDVYVGGTEHAVGHLLYARMWTKALADLGHLSFDEPFSKLVNQGMIQGSSRLAYRLSDTNEFVSAGLIGDSEVDEIRVDVNLVNGLELDLEAFKKWRPDYAQASFRLEEGKYICGSAVEKMSKSKYNVINPDDIVAKYGADTFRMYEMFLGPIELSKPWDTQGIEGVHRFLKKLWRLFYNEHGDWLPTEAPATEAAQRSLHRTIKKLDEDIERFGFNTCVSALMICVNELSSSGCRDRDLLEAMVRMMAPFAPHLSEELWHLFGHENSVTTAAWPAWEASLLVESAKTYPVAINGKPRTEMSFPLDETETRIREAVLANETIAKWLEGREPKKFIYVKGKMINVVV